MTDQNKPVKTERAKSKAASKLKSKPKSKTKSTPKSTPKSKTKSTPKSTPKSKTKSNRAAPVVPDETRATGPRRSRRPRRPAALAGWREWAVLSLAEETPIRAKLDTGAQSSSVHASNIVESEDEHGNLFASFDLHIHEDRSETTSIERHPIVGSRMVLSSSGHWSARPVVATQLQLGDATFKTEVTLAARNEMEFRMLIGRAALRKRFYVDPSHSFVLGEPHGPPTEHLELAGD